MNNNSLWQTNLNRNEHGKFTTSDYGSKTLRSMRLSDQAWNLLGEKAEEQSKSRTDLIEEFARNKNDEQAIIMQALERFIEYKKADFGSNPAQRGKEFNTNTRAWDALREFKNLIENSPWELGIGEE